MEHEWVTREKYGLPDDLNAPANHEHKLKPKTKKPKQEFNPQEMKKKNSKNFSNMFDINMGPR